MNRPARQFACVWLLAMATLLSACETPSAETIALPSFDEVRRDAPAELPTVQAAQALHVLRIEFTIDTPLDALWSHVNEAIASPVLVEAWRYNGMRVGVLPPEQLEAFIAAAPPAIATRRARMITEHTNLLAIYRSPPLHEAVPVDLTVPPLAPRREIVRHGNAQMLGRIVRNAADFPEEFIIELVPHHHDVKTTLRPRLPEEKLLDGRVFEEFAMRLALQPGERIVIGLWREPEQQKREEAIEDSDVDSGAEEQPERDALPEDLDAERAAREAVLGPDDDTENVEEEPVQETEPAAAPLPNHFGRHLLTGRRLGRNVQVLLVITFDEPAPAPPPPTAQR